jgi:hypothetical protein
MWSTVDNSLSPYTQGAKLGVDSVDNECGQMCTNSYHRDFIERGMASIRGRFFCSIFVSVWHDFARSRVTDSRLGRLSIYCRQLFAFHMHVWTGC